MHAQGARKRGLRPAQAFTLFLRGSRDCFLSASAVLITSKSAPSCPGWTFSAQRGIPGSSPASPASVFPPRGRTSPIIPSGPPLQALRLQIPSSCEWAWVPVCPATVPGLSLPPAPTAWSQLQRLCRSVGETRPSYGRVEFEGAYLLTWPPSEGSASTCYGSAASPSSAPTAHLRGTLAGVTLSLLETS